MKRYEFDEHGDPIAISGGEWIRYESHVEAMKRIAGDGGQAVERETLIAVLENEQNNLAASRRQCGKWEGARWDALQQVIEYLYAAPAGASPVALTDDAIADATRGIARLLLGDVRNVDCDIIESHIRALLATSPVKENNND